MESDMRPLTTPRSGCDVAPIRITSPSSSDMLVHRDPVDLGAVDRAEVDDAKAEIVAAHLGVLARRLRIGERYRAVGHAADHGGIVAERDPAAVGQHERAGCAGSRRRRSRRRRGGRRGGRARRRRACTSTGPSKWYPSSRACSRAASASSCGERVAETGEALEVLGRERRP